MQPQHVRARAAGRDRGQGPIIKAQQHFFSRTNQRQFAVHRLHERSHVSVAAADVTAWRTDIDTDRRRQAWAGSNIKTVRITLDAAGTYAVEVSIPGYEPATVEGIEIAADREVTIDALLRQKSD